MRINNHHLNHNRIRLVVIIALFLKFSFDSLFEIGGQHSFKSSGIQKLH